MGGKEHLVFERTVFDLDMRVEAEPSKPKKVKMLDEADAITVKVTFDESQAEESHYMIRNGLFSTFPRTYYGESTTVLSLVDVATICNRLHDSHLASMSE